MRDSTRGRRDPGTGERDDPPRIDAGFLSRAGRRAVDGHEANLSIRAAWLQFVGGHSQSEISGMLGLSRVKVNRLIAEAQREGRVKVFIDGGADRCIALERELASGFGLDGCDVVPNVSAQDPPLDVLGPAGARLLVRVAEDPGVTLVGIGTGRTLSAVARSLPEIPRADLDFVSLLGTFRRSGEVDVHDVVHVLASRIGGRCFALPLPFVVDTAEARDLLLSQAFVRRILESIARTTVKLVGVGSVTPAAHLVDIGMLTASELAEVAALGAVAEVAGQFFDAQGAPVATPLDARFVGLSTQDLGAGRTVVVAGGGDKVAALHAALRAGFCDHLVTDEWTAERVLERSAGL